MKIGYVRVSKQEQNEALQIDALKEAGCEKWYVDKVTGSKAERKGLHEALAYARPGDTFMVWKLDRAGRSLKHLIELLTYLDQHEIGFRSLTEQIDTTTPGGKLIFHLMGALAEFERDLIRERTNAGLAAARARGRVGGRPRKLKTSGKVALARQMFTDQSHSIPVARKLSRLEENIGAVAVELTSEDLPLLQVFLHLIQGHRISKTTWRPYCLALPSFHPIVLTF